MGKTVRHQDKVAREDEGHQLRLDIGIIKPTL